MEFDKLNFINSAFLKRNLLPLSLGIVGVILFAYGLMGLFLSQNSQEEITFEANSQDSNQTAKTIFIDIEGAVVNPGLYKLPRDSRIQDGLVLAGGLAENADRAYISKNINLATKLSDGAKIYIPFVGEVGITSSSANSSLGSEDALSVININTSSQAELELLSGIGPVTAQKIISARPYNSIDELLEKKIVGKSVFDKIKDKITVY